MQGSSRKSGVLATGGWEKRAWTCLLTLMVLFSVADLCADEGNVRYKVLGKEKQYEDIKKRLRDERQSVKKIAGRESTILGELDKVDRVLAGNRRALKLVEKSLKRITKDISTSEGAVSSLKAKQRKYTQLLEKRLVTMYKMRGGGEVRVIMSSLSPTDLERRYHYMNTLLASNATIIDEYGKNIASLDGELRKLKKLQSDKVSLKGRKITTMRETSREKRKRLALLKKVKREKKSRLKVVKELETAAEELQQLIADLTGGAKHTGEKSGFASMRGALPLPVKGTITSFYGKVKHPKFRTITFNNGIFIKAPLEAEVRSVYKGTILYAGWIRGYGQVVIVDHGNGYYTLFAHLATILREVGTPVAAGEVVALVGDTGSLKGAGLYLEVRQNGIPRDPMGWIASR